MDDDIDRTQHCALRSEVHFLVTPLVQYRRHGSQLTSHPANIRDGEQKLWELWRRGEDLSQAQQRTVRQTWRFKQTRFVPPLWRAWGRNHRREGAWRTALVCYAKSAQHCLRLA